MPTKDRYLGSESYKDKRDILAAVLTDGVEYSPEEVEALILRYEQKEVL